jgi:hypothetical protein
VTLWRRAKVTLIGRLGLVPGAVPSADLLGEYPSTPRLNLVGLANADVPFGQTHRWGSENDAPERACKSSSAADIRCADRSPGESSCAK